MNPTQVGVVFTRGNRSYSVVVGPVGSVVERIRVAATASSIVVGHVPRSAEVIATLRLSEKATTGGVLLGDGGNMKHRPFDLESSEITRRT